MALTQSQRILGALKLGPKCGTTFLEWRIPRYAARIHELRGQGYAITSEKCLFHDHETHQTVYRLLTEDQLRLEI